MSYKNIILLYAPDHWKEYANERTILLPSSDEFEEIVHAVRCAMICPNKRISQIERIQNIHDLGQMLIRAQLLISANPHNKYYRVRRFVKIKRQYLDNALKYNLDHRRCGLPRLVFSSSISHTLFSYDDVLIVVQVITTRPNESSEVVPANNLEYFIDYVVHF